MKVALIMPWDTLSGTALQFRQLVIELSKNTELKIFCERDHPDIPNITVPENIPFEKAWNRKIETLDLLFEKLNDFKPNLVHLIHEANWFGLDDRLKSLAEYCKLRDIKLIIQFESPLPEWMKYFGNLDCSAYISGTYPEEEIILPQIGLPSRVFYLPKPILEGALIDKEEAKKILGLSGKRIILTTGFQRLASSFIDIIQGVGSILQDNSDVIFISCGTVHYDERDPEKYYKLAMKEALKMKIQDQIVFTNKFHSEKELFLYGSASEIYVNYRRESNFFFVGGSALRAMSFELPLVAYDHPAIDIIEKGIIRVHNPKEMTNALNLLLTDKDLYSQLKKESRELKEEKSSSNIAKQLIDIYNKVISNVN